MPLRQCSWVSKRVLSKREARTLRTVIYIALLNSRIVSDRCDRVVVCFAVFIPPRASSKAVRVFFRPPSGAVLGAVPLEIRRHLVAKDPDRRSAHPHLVMASDRRPASDRRRRLVTAAVALIALFGIEKKVSQTKDHGGSLQLDQLTRHNVNKAPESRDAARAISCGKSQVPPR